MSRSGDDFDDMDTHGVRHGAGDTIGGAAGAGDELTRFLTELRALGDGPAPAPSRELAAVLAGATPFLSRRVVVRTVLRSAAIAAVLLGVLVVAAANHSLPAPAQHVVSRVVNVLTPFHIGGDRPHPVIEPPRPSAQPTPTHRPKPSPTHSPTPTRRGTTTPAGGGDDGGGPGSGDDGRGDDSGGNYGGTGGGDDSHGSRSPSPRDDGGSSGGSDDGGSDDGGSDDRRSSTSPRPSPRPSTSRSSGGERSGGSDDGGVGGRDD